MSLEPEADAAWEYAGDRPLLTSADAGTSIEPGGVADLTARLAANEEITKAQSIDAAWRQALLRSIRDGLVIFDSEGLILEMNGAFTDLLGYRIEDGPYRPPYPWWPTAEEDAEALALIQRSHLEVLQGQPVEFETKVYRRDRKPVWVSSGGATIQHEALGTTHLRTVRDITRAREARERRAAAAQVGQGFATVDDLAALIGIAEHGFALLFDGDCTIQIGSDGERRWFGASDTVSSDDLPEAVLTGLGGETSPDTVSLRPGILLVPPTGDLDWRGWVQFPRPRRISLEEMIAADLLAAAFGAGLRRVHVVQEAADREANLHNAVESHRLIGQATGILVERHRVMPSEAFERLRRASQQRNLKLRELAARVIETGMEPEGA